jgi:hypothetical protein
MKSLTRRLLATSAALGTVALLAAGPGLATGAFAQSAKDVPNSSQLAPIANEPAPKLTVSAPLPEALARGVAIVPYRVENLRILPVIGADALKLSPRVGHLHVTLNDLPWHWADFSGTNSIIVAPLPPGTHKLLIEVADPEHRVIAAQTVTFTVPGPMK